MSLDSGVDVMINARILGIGEVLYVKEALCLFDTVPCKHRGTRFLVYDEVLLVYVEVLLSVHLFDDVTAHRAHESVSHRIKVGGLGALT